MTNEQAIEHLHKALHHFSSHTRLSVDLDPLERKKLLATLDTAGRLFARLLAEQLPENTAAQPPGTAVDYVYTVHIRDGRVVETIHGPGCVDVTGYTAQEYAADPYLWLRMVHPEDRQKVLQQASALPASTIPEPLEHRIKHKNGSIRWIRNAPVPRYGEDGLLSAYDGVITDITRRKQDEDALRESEHKYRTLFDSSIAAIFLETLQGSILDCNASAVALLGYSREELLGMNVRDLLAPELARKLPELISAISTGSLNLEAANRHKDGRLIPCEVSARLISVGGEKLVLTFLRDLTERNLAESERMKHLEAETRAEVAEQARLVLEREITERRQAETALQESEKRYRILVDTSPDAIFYLNPEMKVIFCNQCAADVYGAENPLQMKGMDAALFLGSENNAWFQEKISYCSCGWAVRRKEFMLLRSDGASFPAEVDAAFVMDGGTRPVGLICIVNDISQRKEMERHLLHAERLSTMGKMSAELAHEIKNPLQSIQSNLELVLDFDLNPLEMQDTLRLCYQEVGRLVELTNSLLRQATPPACQVVSVTDLFHRTIQLVERSSRSVGVEVQSVVPEDFPLLWVEPDQILQVLLNLGINAIDAMPAGGLLTFSAEISADGVCLHVINDGTISPPEKLENIFEPFYTTKTSGTGLGLPISYNIVQKLGGSLRAANLHDPDRVMFTILLPGFALPDSAGEP